MVKRMNRTESIAEAKRRETLWETTKKNFNYKVAHKYDVIVIGGKIVKNRFGDTEAPCPIKI